MINCLVNMGKVREWEFRPTSKTFNYSITLNPNTRLLQSRFAIGHILTQLKGLNVHFNFTVYSGNREVLYEYKC